MMSGNSDPMVSNVDPSKPTHGRAYTADVRNNFAIIKSETETLYAGLQSLQDAIDNIPVVDLSGYLPLSGGVMQGMLTLDAITGIDSPGDIRVFAGPIGAGTDVGGNLLFYGADGVNGGGISFQSGDATTGLGGNFTFIAGGSNSGSGGNLTIKAGGGRDASAKPGTIFLQGGDGFAATPGDVSISGGWGSVTAKFGKVLIRGLEIIPQSDAASIWNNNGVVNIGAGSAPIDLSSYLPVDGSTAMTGTIKLAGNAVGSVLSLIAEGVHPATGSGNYLVAKSADGTTGNGGNIQFSAGATSAAGKYAGSVTFWGGSGGSTADGGSVSFAGGFGVNPGTITFSAGGRSGGGAYGEIKMLYLATVPQAADSIWNNMGVLNIGAGAVLVTKEEFDDLVNKVNVLESRLLN